MIFLTCYISSQDNQGGVWGVKERRISSRILGKEKVSHFCSTC
ncbi:hypothetical protein HanIR_Chr17g0885781 [Helianthus annuus]|nr:hypothetical protein HanIR_Chr17g0885781 [Helianthus annuus]